MVYRLDASGFFRAEALCYARMLCRVKTDSYIQPSWQVCRING